MTKIIGIESFDVRFPTSKMLDGSDAMNQDPDYSAAYLRITTDKAGLHGDSLVFTIGRGNDVQIAAIDMLTPKIQGLSVDDAFARMMFSSTPSRATFTLLRQVPTRLSAAWLSIFGA